MLGGWKEDSLADDGSTPISAKVAGCWRSGWRFRLRVTLLIFDTLS